jgi:hypothetical protein
MKRRIAASLGFCVFAILTAAQAISADKPQILSRADWGASPAVIASMKEQTPREIIIHHTGVRQQPKKTLQQKLRGLQGYSQNEKGWGDAPYHFYIGVSGGIGEARSVKYAGDTNTPYDVQDRIQIVVEGHFDEEKPAAAQLASLKQLVGWLSAEYGIPSSRISSHNDHASTDCPGKFLKPLIPAMLEQIAQ